jgi:hypothetical protein
VRVIDAYINRLDWAVFGFSHPQPHETGRSMYDQKDVLKRYVYGYEPSALITAAGNEAESGSYPAATQTFHGS